MEAPCERFSINAVIPLGDDRPLARVGVAAPVRRLPAVIVIGSLGLARQAVGSGSAIPTRDLRFLCDAIEVYVNEAKSHPENTGVNAATVDRAVAALLRLEVDYFPENLLQQAGSWGLQLRSIPHRHRAKQTKAV